MNRPTVLRNSAEPEIVIGVALKIFYNANDWVNNSDYLDKLDHEYDLIGKARESRTGGQAIAKYKPAVYYGLLDISEDGRSRRINEIGRRYYEAYINNNQVEMVDCLVHSICKRQFGQNNPAVPDSRSQIEPPKVFLVSCLLLNNKLGKTEYAYIIENLANEKDYKKILVEISLARMNGTELKISDYAKNNYKDDKGLKFLSDAGFFNEDKGIKSIKSQYVLKYSDILSSLSIITNEDDNSNITHADMDIFKYNARPLQQISYGAPGTGKSFGINEDIKTQGLDAVRTTFHPDSDYSTFVGAYKPAIGKAKVYGAQGPLQHQGNDVEEDKITYKFVPQAFTKAYVKAWQKMAEPSDEGKTEPQILVIEEINRGNCAQIFGDLFQLLDRDDNGYSSYPIQADEDLRQHIAQELATCEGLSDKFENIKNGTELMLPPNLYIWATMNTSDQSLFPIDSAFKRRWEWKYMKISNAGKNWKITAGDKQYDWWKFIEKINNEIAAATSSDDKKLGYFFCKPNEGDAINAERFVGKVIFYLWNDVFKDEAPAFFNVIENTEPSFDAFFEQDGEVNTAAVQKFMQALGVEAIE